MKRKLTVITILAMLPLIAAGILWLIYRDMERKITEANKEADRCT